MSFDLQVTAHREYLYVTLTGRVTVPESKTAIVAIGDAAWKARLTRILIDWRQVADINTLTVIDRFEVARFLADQVAQLRVRGLNDLCIANVTPEVRSDAEEFSVTVAANRGVNMIVTKTLADALAWLGVENGG